MAFLGIVKGFEFPDHPGLKEHRQSLLPGSCWNKFLVFPGLLVGLLNVK